ncbi:MULTISPECIES: isochorismatase family protein [Arthrobacter]|uniref:Isochorismatase family protein n=2 Tax=Arthrobacter TaxID=1663 RepID=A0ABU9KNB4_9MICC|nr:isochorismatase family protein [Arthrobacter sp. YJM1]MDP5228449.1 isochorismatase family protein [Arthrobacter sp. YJM1]
MTLSAIDTHSALVVIDLQNGIVGRLRAGEDTTVVDAVVGNSRKLADAFRTRGLPVVLVNVAGAPVGRTDAARRMPAEVPADYFALVDGLNTSDDDVLLTKHSVGAFATTELDAVLRERGVTQIVLTGIATSVGVESTARNAHDLGYNVVLTVDAMTDLTPSAHDYAVANVFPRLGESTTTQDVLAALAARG